MPVRKPAGLNRRHDTAEDKAKRAENEASLTPRRCLPIDAPARLKGHKVAAATWRQAMRLYNELEATIVTRLDLDQLVDYCLLMEQAHEINEMRQVMHQAWESANAHWEEIIADKSGEEVLLAAEKLEGIQDGVVKLDARVERKFALLKNYRESLYLTPRARAATAPTKKEKEVPPDDMERLLDEVNEYVNGDKGDGR